MTLLSGERSVALGDVATFIRGITFKPTDVVPEGTQGTVACMRTKNVQSVLDVTDVWSVSRSFVKREDRYLRPGDVLIASANSAHLVGRCCWVPALSRPSTFGGFVSVLRAMDSAVDARYLYWWFSSPAVQATLRTFGRQTTNIVNLDLARCRELRLPLPLLKEQRRIAEVLDRADGLLYKRREALALLEHVEGSILNEMFDLNGLASTGVDLASLTTRITDGTHQSPEWQPDGVPFLFVSNIVSGEIDFSTRKYISHGTHDELMRRCPVEKGDVLYSTVGTYGIPAVVRTVAKFAFQRHIAHIKPDLDRLQPNYLAAMLRSPQVRKQADRAARGVAQLTVNLSDVRGFRVLCPPMEQQLDFADRCHAVDVVRAKAKLQERELTAGFVSLQQQAFSGHL